MRSREKRAPAIIPCAARSVRSQGVSGIEEILLVLLHVLVVGERQRVERSVQGRKASQDPGRLGTQQLGGVGVLLLGHDRRARAPRIG